MVDGGVGGLLLMDGRGGRSGGSIQWGDMTSYGLSSNGTGMGDFWYYQRRMGEG